MYNMRMFYIVGLGNPGEKYTETRHNVGWQALDYCATQFGWASLIADKHVSGRVTEGRVVGVSVQVLYPDTFMNNSGSAVVKFVPKEATGQLIVVHDDIDLPLGEVKLAKGRGAGGNNGVSSIVQKLGTKDFIRIRVGIAPTSFWTGKIKRPRGGGPLERFVLQQFTKTEQKQLPEVFETVKTALELIVSEGVEAAMNSCN